MSDGGPSCGARSSRPLTATLQRVGPAVVSGAACHPRGMARTWLSVTVELLGGRGEELWPWPGRVFAVGPSHTFLDLAGAINDAFGRWDRAHLSLFPLADGRVITDEPTGSELAGSTEGPITVPLDIGSAKVARVLEPGAEFQFVFDLGDEW